MTAIGNRNRHETLDGDSRKLAHTPDLCQFDAPFGESQNSGTGDRDERGRFQKGNLAAFQHGARSEQVLQSLTQGDEANAALAEHRAEIEGDLGPKISRVKRDLISRYVECCAIANFLAHDVADRGALTVRGRSRAVLNAYLSVLDRQHRLAVSIGLEKRLRRVSLRDELAGAPA